MRLYLSFGVGVVNAFELGDFIKYHVARSIVARDLVKRKGVNPERQLDLEILFKKLSVRSHASLAAWA